MLVYVSSARNSSVHRVNTHVGYLWKYDGNIGERRKRIYTWSRDRYRSSIDPPSILFFFLFTYLKKSNDSLTVPFDCIQIRHRNVHLYVSREQSSSRRSKPELEIETCMWSGWIVHRPIVRSQWDAFAKLNSTGRRTVPPFEWRKTKAGSVTANTGRNNGRDAFNWRASLTSFCRSSMLKCIVLFRERPLDTWPHVEPL